MILEALATSHESKGVSELARELDLTKSNVFRILQSLAALGYVRSTEDKTYRATLKLWQVGRAIVENVDLREIAAGAMQDLAAQTHETIYLSVPDGLNVVYIDKIESARPIRSWNPIGGSAPIHCVGTGKAILSLRYQRLRERLSGHLGKYTERTITSLPELDAEMARTRARGFAIDNGEFRDRIRSYGAAICLPDGRPVGAIGISVPETNLEPGDEERYCALVRDAARDITSSLANG
jgi:DNA-binding IclR family transcriptional regulator